MPSEAWDEITYPNFNGYTIEVSEWIDNSIPHFIMDVITYICLDFIHVKRGPWAKSVNPFVASLIYLSADFCILCVISLHWNDLVVQTLSHGRHVYPIHIDVLVQDCSNSIANALELLQSCTKPSIYKFGGCCWTGYTKRESLIHWRNME